MMHKQTQARTLSVLLALIGLVLMNTFLSAALRLYGEVLAWTVYGVAIVLLVVALRFQQRLSGAALAALLGLPFALALLFAVIGPALSQ
jgi:hypothetical protein